MKIIRINKERRNKWIHFTLVWLIGIIITTLVAFVSNQHFDDFPSFIIPVLVGGLICWIIGPRGIVRGRRMPLPNQRR